VAPLPAAGVAFRVASNTILGPCSQGPSRHVLPHAAPGFFVGRGHRGWWSSPNFASILLAPRDDILALCLGGCSQSQGMAILSSSAVVVFPLGLGSHGFRLPIYSNGAQHRIRLTDGVATLSGHYLYMKREVFVCYRKHWHVCSRPDDIFSVLVL
jgi:hypothetical protein